MSQKRLTLLISLIICQVVFLNVFVFGESESKADLGKLDEPCTCTLVASMAVFALSVMKLSSMYECRDKPKRCFMYLFYFCLLSSWKTSKCNNWRSEWFYNCPELGWTRESQWCYQRLSDLFYEKELYRCSNSTKWGKISEVYSHWSR